MHLPCRPCGRLPLKTLQHRQRTAAVKMRVGRSLGENRGHVEVAALVFIVKAQSHARLAVQRSEKEGVLA